MSAWARVHILSLCSNVAIRPKQKPPRLQRLRAATTADAWLPAALRKVPRENHGSRMQSRDSRGTGAERFDSVPWLGPPDGSILGIISGIIFGVIFAIMLCIMFGIILSIISAVK